MMDSVEVCVRVCVKGLEEPVDWASFFLIVISLMIVMLLCLFMFIYL